MFAIIARILPNIFLPAPRAKHEEDQGRTYHLFDRPASPSGLGLAEWGGQAARKRSWCKRLRPMATWKADEDIVVRRPSPNNATSAQEPTVRVVPRAAAYQKYVALRLVESVRRSKPWTLLDPAKQQDFPRKDGGPGFCFSARPKASGFGVLGPL